MAEETQPPESNPFVAPSIQTLTESSDPALLSAPLFVTEAISINAPEGVTVTPKTGTQMSLTLKGSAQGAVALGHINNIQYKNAFMISQGKVTTLGSSFAADGKFDNNATSLTKDYGLRPVLFSSHYQDTDQPTLVRLELGADKNHLGLDLTLTELDPTKFGEDDNILQSSVISGNTDHNFDELTLKINKDTDVTQTVNITGSQSFSKWIVATAINNLTLDQVDKATLDVNVTNTTDNDKSLALGLSDVIGSLAGTNHITVTGNKGTNGGIYLSASRQMFNPDQTIDDNELTLNNATIQIKGGEDSKMNLGIIIGAAPMDMESDWENSEEHQPTNGSEVTSSHDMEEGSSDPYEANSYLTLKGSNKIVVTGHDAIGVNLKKQEKIVLVHSADMRGSRTQKTGELLNASLSNEGTLTISADKAFVGNGSIENTGNITVEKGSLADFTGSFTQTEGESHLKGASDFFTGSVTITGGTLEANTATIADNSELNINGGSVHFKNLTLGDGKKLVLGGSLRVDEGLVFGSDASITVTNHNKLIANYSTLKQLDGIKTKIIGKPGSILTLTHVGETLHTSEMFTEDFNKLALELVGEQPFKFEVENLKLVNLETAVQEALESEDKSLSLFTVNKLKEHHIDTYPLKQLNITFVTDLNELDQIPVSNVQMLENIDPVIATGKTFTLAHKGQITDPLVVSKNAQALPVTVNGTLNFDTYTRGTLASITLGQNGTINVKPFSELVFDKVEPAAETTASYITVDGQVHLNQQSVLNTLTLNPHGLVTTNEILTVKQAILGDPDEQKKHGVLTLTSGTNQLSLSGGIEGEVLLNDLANKVNPTDVNYFIKYKSPLAITGKHFEANATFDNSIFESSLTEAYQAAIFGPKGKEPNEGYDLPTPLNFTAENSTIKTALNLKKLTNAVFKQEDHFFCISTLVGNPNGNNPEMPVAFKKDIGFENTLNIAQSDSDFHGQIFFTALNSINLEQDKETTLSMTLNAHSDYGDGLFMAPILQITGHLLGTTHITAATDNGQLVGILQTSRGYADGDPRSTPQQLIVNNATVNITGSNNANGKTFGVVVGDPGDTKVGGYSLPLLTFTGNASITVTGHDSVGVKVRNTYREKAGATRNDDPVITDEVIESTFENQGNLTISADRALVGNGTVKNSGHITITRGNVNSFTGHYLQTDGELTLNAATGYLGGKVTINGGQFQAQAALVTKDHPFTLENGTVFFDTLTINEGAAMNLVGGQLKVAHDIHTEQNATLNIGTNAHLLMSYAYLKDHPDTLKIKITGESGASVSLYDLKASLNKDSIELETVKALKAQLFGDNATLNLDLGDLKLSSKAIEEALKTPEKKISAEKLDEVTKAGIQNDQTKRLNVTDVTNISDLSGTTVSSITLKDENTHATITENKEISLTGEGLGSASDKLINKDVTIEGSLKINDNAKGSLDTLTLEKDGKAHFGQNSDITVASINTQDANNAKIEAAGKLTVQNGSSTADLTVKEGGER